MHETATEEEKLLKQLIQEIRILNEKIDTLPSKISRELILKPQKKKKREKIKEKLKASANFSYALGGLAIAVAALLFGFSQQIATFAYYSGSAEKFYLFWDGCGLLLLSGVILILGGFIEDRYSDEIGTIRKFKIFGHKIEIITNWKREILPIVSFVILAFGVILLFQALM